MFEKDKSNYYKRDKRLVKAAIEMKKTAKEDDSQVQMLAARKLYKASSIY